MHRTGHPTTLMTAIATAMLLVGCSSISTTSNGVQTTSDGTSSTSNAASGVASTHQQAVAFVRTQLPAIREDAAHGSGAATHALGQLLNRENPAHFARWMQDHYRQLFVDLEQPVDLLARIERLQTVPPQG